MERFTLDYKSIAPFADQLAIFLHEQIRKGIILPGEKMPTVREGVAIFNVGAVTVNKAYQILIKDDILESRGRQGIYVVEDVDGEKKELLFDMDLDLRKLLTEVKDYGERNSISCDQMISLLKQVYQAE